MAKFSVVGAPLPRPDSLGKVSGETEFLSDIELAGMLHGKILRSPFPHARILKIDTSKAARLKGVKAIITAQDTPKIKFSFIDYLADKYALNDDKVRYIGDEVAAVAAVDLPTAEEAIDLIDVEYEELPAVYDPEEAMAEGAVKVHDKERNISWQMQRRFGDPERGFVESDYIFEDKYVTSRQCHCCMEPRGCIAYYDRTGALTLWVNSQTPHTLRQEAAKILDIPASKVRVINPPIGGGFGARIVVDMKNPIAAIISRKTGRPVKIVNTRKEEFEVSKTRYAYSVYVKTGVKKDGTILARQLRTIVDNGAYNDKAPATLSFSGSMFTMLYRVPNILYNAYVVYTNKQPGTGFRGFGNPQVTFAAETQLDEIAKKLAIDPVEIRLKNCVRQGDISITGAHFSKCGLTDCIERATEASGWRTKKGKMGPNRGIGAAVMIHTGGGNRFYGYNSSSAFIKVSEDAVITLVTPAVDTGQGAETVVAQIAAEELGVRLADIRVIARDTELTPYDLGAWGSRTTWVSGNAVLNAARAMKEQIFGVVAEALEASPKDLTARDGRIFVAGSPDKYLGFEDAVHYAYKKRGMPLSASGTFHDEPASSSKDWDTQTPNFASACQVAEVEVDPETGKVRVLNLTAAHDAGRTINPLLAEGQIEGGFAQGIGYALTEGLIIENGRTLNPSFIDYKIPGFPEVPDSKTILLETDNPGGPYGAIGIGEPALVPTAAAIANAIYDSVGVRIKSLPMTSEKIYAAMKGRSL